MPDATPSSAPSNHRLAFRRLHRRFGRVRVLEDVSGEVTDGRILLVTGDNGSGKSTLLRCLAGLMRPQRGEIECTVGGEELDAEERRHEIGFLSPTVELYDELTTRENLDFFAELRHVDDERGGELLDRLGLPQDRPAAALSSGMLQRLRWAWALLHRPSVLLLDEPLQNLDSRGRRDVLELLDEHLDDGLAVVASPDPMDLPRPLDRLDLRHIEHERARRKASGVPA